MPCHAHYVTFIPFCVLCNIFIQYCTRCLAFIPQCVCCTLLLVQNLDSICYFFSMLCVLCYFHSTLCTVCHFCSTMCVCVCVVKYISFHIVCGQHSFCSMLCVLCTTFIPWNKKVPHSTNLHSILCAVCAFTPCSTSCVLFLFNATCARHYIIVFHGMCTTCYFSSMLGLPCIIFIPCYVY